MPDSAANVQNQKGSGKNRIYLNDRIGSNIFNNVVIKCDNPLRQITCAMTARGLYGFYFLLLQNLRVNTPDRLFWDFVLVFLLSFVFWKTYPILSTSLFLSTERIGLVGEFSPSTLPQLIQNQVSVGLTSLSPDGTPVPALAASWEATNSGKTFIFTLRDDWKWHSGKPVTAHDINYNIRGDVNPTGERTLIAYLQYPYSPFPTLVSKPIFTRTQRYRIVQNRRISYGAGPPNPYSCTRGQSE